MILTTHSALRRLAAAALIGVALLTAAACSSDDDPEANDITVTGTEFAFEVTDGALTAGTNNITFRNDGQQVHHLQLVQLLEDKTLEDIGPALAASETEGFPTWMHFAGGVGQIAPGGTGTIVADITEGNYALICFVPDTDGAPHFVKGMLGSVSTEGDASEAELPEPAASFTALDYGFGGPQTIEAGEDVVLELTNIGAELHEMNIFRLDDGATIQDFLGAFAPDAASPPPATPVGGVQGILPGESQLTSMDLDAGSYVLICFIPNAEGVPHVALGMATGLEVTE